MKSLRLVLYCLLLLIVGMAGFIIFTNGSYFGDAAGNPYRHWFLRDVYPRSEIPIYWGLLYTGEVHRAVGR